MLRSLVGSEMCIRDRLCCDEKSAHEFFSPTVEKGGAPRDGFKMRAASALNSLASIEHAHVQQLIKDHLEKANADKIIDDREVVSIVWLASQPRLLDCMRQIPGLVENCQKDLSSESSWDRIILALAPVTTFADAGRIMTPEVEDQLMTMFDPNLGHSMTCRWAILCESLLKGGLGADIVQHWNPDGGGLTGCVGELVTKLVVWLQSGHPYKKHAMDVLSKLVENESLQKIAFEQLAKGYQNGLPPGTPRTGKAGLAFLRQSFENLFKQ
eukprot:TRINITY_DN58162_c0_g1_i1.p1 TRINITY_DN58162_c0_g1~~TRINITY_DN58162_c0_g1_i1.p1  ORF type:complete len:269 (-),score=65.81 TRINITY_DN58162_c0_g1_i1:244-1050(-)